MKVICKVCDGTGKVPGNFGGRCGSPCEKIKCPACDGSGMQDSNNECCKRKCCCNNCWCCPCRRTWTYPIYTPYYPCTNGTFITYTSQGSGYYQAGSGGSSSSNFGTPTSFNGSSTNTL